MQCVVSRLMFLEGSVEQRFALASLFFCDSQPSVATIVPGFPKHIFNYSRRENIFILRLNLLYNFLFAKFSNNPLPLSNG